jgi:hypothetical protein
MMAQASVQWNSSAWSTMPTRDVLASVIQGEAGGYQGQLAVANVMANRLYSGQFGNNIEDVVTPGNFNGFQAPTNQSYTLADQLINGELPGSQAGNSLYFAAPAQGDAAWTQGLFNSNAPNIGGNYFSDRPGAPSADFTGGTNSGVDMSAPTANNQPGFDVPSQPYSLPGGAGGATLPTSSDAGNFAAGPDSAYTGGASIAPGISSSDIGSMAPTSGSGQATDFLGGAYSPQATEGLPGPLQSILGGGQSFNLMAPTSDFQGQAPSAQAKTPASTEGQVAEAKATEDEAKSVAKAAETGAKAIGQLAKQQAGTGQQASTTAAQDTASTVATDKSIAQNVLDTSKDLTQRFFIAFFGLILLAGAVYYFSKSGASSQVAYAT